MAQPIFKAYGVTNLPTTDIDTGGLYFLQQDEDTGTFSIHLRDNDNSMWYDLTTIQSTVHTVNNLTGDVIIDLNFADGVLNILATGDGSASTVASIDLDDRYRIIGVPINWSEIVGVPDFALDDNVLHKTGNETKQGTLTFEDSPEVPTPTSPPQAANKGYVDSAIDGIEDEISDLDNRFVRYDAQQQLTIAQQETARSNINAASAEDVEWATKEW